VPLNCEQSWFGRFVGRLFHTLVHSLSVCISLLDPKRAATVAAAGAARGQHITEPVATANPETVEGMLQRLGIYTSIVLLVLYF
jgi:serine/threonine-protein phosphatase 6 regulatory subunit 3